MMQWNMVLPDGSSTPLIDSCIGDLSSLLFYMESPAGQYTIRFKMGYKDANGNVSYTDYAEDSFYHSGVGAATPVKKTIRLNTASQPAICTREDARSSHVITIDDVTVEITQ